VLAIRPRLRSRLELVWRPGAQAPAAQELVERLRAALVDRPSPAAPRPE
jgi:hypothetical protein